MKILFPNVTSEEVLEYRNRVLQKREEILFDNVFKNDFNRVDFDELMTYADALLTLFIVAGALLGEYVMVNFRSGSIHADPKEFRYGVIIFAVSLIFGFLSFFPIYWFRLFREKISVTWGNKKFDALEKRNAVLSLAGWHKYECGGIFAFFHYLMSIHTHPNTIKKSESLFEMAYEIDQCYEKTVLAERVAEFMESHSNVVLRYNSTLEKKKNTILFRLSEPDDSIVPTEQEDTMEFEINFKDPDDYKSVLNELKDDKFDLDFMQYSENIRKWQKSKLLKDIENVKFENAKKPQSCIVDPTDLANAA